MNRFLVTAVFIVFFILSLESAVYTGRIVSSDTPAEPIANVTVALQTASTAIHTDSTGRFTLGKELSGSKPYQHSAFSTIRFENGRLSFSCTRNEHVRFELYSMDGRCFGILINRQFSTGKHSLALNHFFPVTVSPGLYIARVLKAGKQFTSSLLVPVPGTGYAAPVTISMSGPVTSGSTDGTLTIRKMGYIPVNQTVPTETTDLGDIVLNRTAAEAAIEMKVDSVLSLMTLEEKAGQMVQTLINFTKEFPGRFTDEQIASMGIGSVFNGGSEASIGEQPNTPDSWAQSIDRMQKAVLTSSRLKIPVIYGQDCVHGVAEIDGCTIFPHNIGLGCTFDSALVAKIGRITAEEAAGVGVTLNFWPCIASVRNERWGRAYEGFGETPEVNALLGAAYVRGHQGDGNLAKSGAIAACAKHYLGDGATDDGVNNGITSISEATMRAVHLPQFAASVREQLATVMPSYHTWSHDGYDWKQTLDHKALTDILKKDLGFDGFCISDWDAVLRACNSYGPECVASAINAGLDMAMIVGDAGCSEFIESVVSGVNSGTISQSRVDDAVKRILRIKFRLGLFDHPFSDPTLRAQINSSDKKAVARESVRKSMVLLKNEEQVLPLKKTENIVVVGPWANSMGAQCGGWTISWQGDISHTGIAGQTILSGLQEAGGTVSFDEYGDNLSGADKIIVVIGETPYAEGNGDVSVPDLSGCPNSSLVEKCYNSGKPVILLMLTGRPMLIDTEIGWCKAVVACWLPGGEGGGIADVLFGDYDFTGKLSNTWPASAEQIPINSGPEYSDEQHGSGGEPHFPYGFGLTYQ
jgi:beta-glucosidase